MGFAQSLDGADLGKGARPAAGKDNPDTMAGDDTRQPGGIVDVFRMGMKPAGWLDDTQPGLGATGDMRLEIIRIHQHQIRRAMQERFFPGAGRGVGRALGIGQQEDMIDLTCA